VAIGSHKTNVIPAEAGIQIRQKECWIGTHFYLQFTQQIELIFIGLA
jgi:hypothetical protein